jgi:hypothetical protein
MVLRLYHTRLDGKRPISQQESQLSESFTVDGGGRWRGEVTTNYRIEHPLGHLQHARRLKRVQRTAQNDLPVLRDRVEDPHPATVPWVPAIQNFP